MSTKTENITSQVMTLLLQGNSQVDIASQLNVSRETVRKCINTKTACEIINAVNNRLIEDMTSLQIKAKNKLENLIDSKNENIAFKTCAYLLNFHKEYISNHTGYFEKTYYDDIINNLETSQTEQYNFDMQTIDNENKNNN